MDNLAPEINDCVSIIGNKRKRRLSSTESINESPKKKISSKSINTVSLVEQNLDKTQCINCNYGSTDGYDNCQIGNAEQFQTQFLLVELCDEVLYEIFKFLDTWSLMSLMNVCKRLQTFVLDKRLWENINLNQEPLPLGILEDMLERSHDKTKIIKLRGPSPSQHIEGEIQHFNKTINISLTTRCTKLITLELFSVTLDFNQISLMDFPQTLKRLVLNTCNIRTASTKSLFTGIDTILINLEELAIENNAWFDPYYVMSLSKLPLLRYLSLKGCCQMQEFIPYGSIAARHGFKHLEILDLRHTPLNDSDLQCFNAVGTLKEIYLQCPEDDNSTKSNNMESDNDKPTSSSGVSATNANYSDDFETPSTSTNTNLNKLRNEQRIERIVASLTSPTTLDVNDIEFTSSSSSCSSSPSSSPDKCSIADNNTSEASSSARSTPNIVPLIGTNAPPRNRILPRPDNVFYLDIRNPANARRDNSNLRHMLFGGHAQQQQQQNLQQQSPPPIIEQMMRHNLFWDIVNPLGRVVGEGNHDRLFGEENGGGYHLNLRTLLSSHRQQSRGTISDRGVCCFGRTRQPVQQGVIWIRLNNRPSENRFERFSVRDYKYVTDISLKHLVECSPHLIFLDVSGTSVTLEGLQRFKELKTECIVVAEHLLGDARSETTVS